MSAAKIIIVSGEGEQGTMRNYTGKKTVRALRARLTRETCGGDRWARAEVWRDDELTQESAEDVISATPPAK